MGRGISEDSFMGSFGKKKLAVFPSSSTWYYDVVLAMIGMSAFIVIYTINLLYRV
jgi:hypothetical protein